MSFLKLHFNIFGFLYCGHARSIVTDLNCGKCMPFRANCIAKDMAYWSSSKGNWNCDSAILDVEYVGKYV